MAFYRQVQLSFWSDEKVLDDFTPEDKYFYLYLFTNPQTNLCGCYQLGWSQTTNQMGYTKETIERLIDRFVNVHKVIKYSKDTKELLLLNWHKYNWTTSARFLISLRNEIVSVKTEEYKAILKELFNDYLKKALANKDIKEKELEMLEKIEFFDVEEGKNIPYTYGMDTSVTVTVNNTVNNISSFSENIKEIIDYFNTVCNTRYTYKNKSYNSKITARLNDGFTVHDFKTVIDKKFNEWHGTDMEQYLTPDTLFAPSKFEKYLNQPAVTNKNKVTEKRQDVLSSWAQKRGVFDV